MRLSIWRLHFLYAFRFSIDKFAVFPATAEVITKKLAIGSKCQMEIVSFSNNINTNLFSALRNSLTVLLRSDMRTTCRERRNVGLATVTSAR